MSFKIIAQSAGRAAAVPPTEDKSAAFKREAIAKFQWFRGLPFDQWEPNQYPGYSLVLLSMISDRFNRLLTSEERNQLGSISSSITRKVAELSPKTPPATPLRRSLIQLANKINSGNY